MRKFLFRLALACVLCSPLFASHTSARNSLPQGFVYITDQLPEALVELRYYSSYNFVGVRVDGYNAPVAILSKAATEGLKKAAGILRRQGYIIKIYDGYRPQRAVNHFIRWARDPQDIKTTEAFYPSVDKSTLFVLGYIARKSAHSRGSAVDLTLVEFRSGRELDMGCPFDFFGEVSHYNTDQIDARQRENRDILRRAMVEAGFIAHPKEWWHFRFGNEPFPDTYFDFPVE